MYYAGCVKTFDSLYAELLQKSLERPDGSKTVAELDAGVHAIDPWPAVPWAMRLSQARPFSAVWIDHASDAEQLTPPL